MKDRMPLQIDGHNCGVYVIKNVEKLLHSMPTSTRADIDSQFSKYFHRDMYTVSEILEERNIIRDRLRELQSLWENRVQIHSCESESGVLLSDQDAPIEVSRVMGENSTGTDKKKFSLDNRHLNLSTDVIEMDTDVDTDSSMVTVTEIGPSINVTVREVSEVVVSPSVRQSVSQSADWVDECSDIDIDGQ